MMHEHGMQMKESVHLRDLLMTKIHDDLTDDQKTRLIGRMIDARIQKKEIMIEYLKFRIATFRMVKDFLCG